VEGFEAFVEKRMEYGEMMDGHVADLRAVIREQVVIAEGLNRAAKLNEERRLQEFHRALERMDPGGPKQLGGPSENGHSIFKDRLRLALRHWRMGVLASEPVSEQSSPIFDGYCT
jgi:hypothetical protein